MQKLLIIIALILGGSVQYVRASVTTAKPGSGNWTNAGSWNNGVPGCYDTIIIPAGSTITVNIQINLEACPKVVMLINGTLIFANGKKLYLPTDSELQISSSGLVAPTSGGGSSNLIEIGGTVVWTTADGSLTGPSVLCNGCTLLPVEMGESYAELEGRIAHFYWFTISEHMNDFFLLERLSSTGELIPVTQVPGQGTTTVKCYYHVQEELYDPGVYYFVLSQTDWDGIRTNVQTFSINYNPNSTITREVDLLGRPISDDYTGIRIVTYSDGSSAKLVR